MALKFLNKKGWHTGSLRNIENVWKAEQKHNAEEKKLDELRKQIQEERERSDFRRLQEQAGLVPRQERLDFLYESGLAVGKTSEGFRDLAAPAPVPAAAAAADAPAPQAAVPGALFEDKPQSANDAWRKLHTDPLLLIRQREKEALDRIKNNPMKMAMIRKSVEADKKDKHGKKEKREKKDRKRKHKSKHSPEVMSDSEESEYEKNSKKKEHSASEHHQHKSKKKKHSSGSKSDSEDFSEGDREGKERDPSNHSKRTHPYRSDSKHTGGGDEDRREGKRNSEYRSDSKHTGGGDEDRREGKRTSEYRSDSKRTGGGDDDRRESKRTNSEYHSDSKHRGGGYEDRKEGKRTNSDHHGEERQKSYQPISDIRVEKNLSATQTQDNRRPYGYNRRQNVPKLSEEERASRLREMQIDAELHEEQRWKRLKKAADADANEANTARPSGGKNFLDAAQRSIYGTEKGGSSTIEESVRRRAYYSQGGSADHESNAFRR